MTYEPSRLAQKFSWQIRDTECRVSVSEEGCPYDSTLEWVRGLNPEKAGLRLDRYTPPLDVLRDAFLEMAKRSKELDLAVETTDDHIIFRPHVAAP